MSARSKSLSLILYVKHFIPAACAKFDIYDDAYLLVSSEQKILVIYELIFNLVFDTVFGADTFGKLH